MAYEAWIGREEERRERICRSVVGAMAATLDLERAPQSGEPLPPGWQWLFFNPVVRRSELGIDGHPRLGGFLPPIELPRRMWAGSRIRYLSDLPIEAQATRRSRILKIENKAGKRSSLTFVTVEHIISCEGTPCISEEQDIVYRDAAAAARAVPERYDGVPHWSRRFEPDTTLLFRYSALTFNGHRIHYDRDYVTKVEGYPGLIFHGPLQAAFIVELAAKLRGGKAPKKLTYRGVQPLFEGSEFSVNANDNGASMELWTANAEGQPTMKGTATW